MSYIKDRIIKKGTDRNGNSKQNVKVYDVYYRYTDPTTGEAKKTSKKGFRTKKDAENFETEINSQILHNKFVQPKKLTVREYLTEWLDTYVETNLRDTTKDGYRRNIEKHIIPCIGSIELQKISANDVDKFYVDKLKSGRLDGKGGLSQKSLLYIHRVLCEAMEHAARKNMIPKNVVKDIPNKPKPKKFKNDIYDDTELKELLLSTNNTYMEIAVALGGVYGLRRGEVLGLKWSAIDFEKEIISICRQLVPIRNKIVFTDPKSEESIRTLPLTQGIKEILLRRKEFQKNQLNVMKGTYEDNDMVVCNDDGTLIDPRNFSKRFSDLLRKYNMKHIRFHDLRHTCATLMQNLGVDLKDTSTWLGHSSISITSDIYIKPVTKKKVHVANLVSDSIFNHHESD
jgi:integrase